MSAHDCGRRAELKGLQAALVAKIPHLDNTWMCFCLTGTGKNSLCVHQVLAVHTCRHFRLCRLQHTVQLAALVVDQAECEGTANCSIEYTRMCHYRSFSSHTHIP